MKRHYVRVSSFALATIIDALDKDEKVKGIMVSLEDNDLLVAFDFDKYVNERAKPCNVNEVIKESKQEKE